MSYGINLHISGDFACFTRPEIKVERVSSPHRHPQVHANQCRFCHLTAGLRFF